MAFEFDEDGLRQFNFVGVPDDELESQLEFHSLRMNKAWREVEEKFAELEDMYDAEEDARDRGEKCPYTKQGRLRKRTQLRNRLNVCLSIFKNSSEAHGAVLEELVFRMETNSSGGDWPVGAG